MVIKLGNTTLLLDRHYSFRRLQNLVEVTLLLERICTFLLIVIVPKSKIDCDVRQIWRPSRVQLVTSILI